MLADEFEVIIANSDARRWRRIMRNCWIAVAASFIVAAASCCAFGQIKLEQTTVAPYQLWVGFVAPEIQADGTVKASVDSKPVSKTVQPDPRFVLVIDEGYSLKDLEVETVPGLEFVQPTLTQLDGNRIELKIDATGKFRARAELDYGGKKIVSRFNFTIGTAPKPPPKPDDPPVPAPDGINPFEAPGFRVMIVYESRDGVPRQYTGDVRAYLDAKCTKENNIPQRLIIDQNSSFAPGTELWQKVMARGQKSLPWIVIGNEATGYEGPLPSSAAGVLELLKKYGG